MSLRQNISRRELIIYIVIWTSSVIYSIYCFAISSNKHFQYYDDVHSDFNQGWSFLSRKKDAGDYELKTIKFLIEKASWWIISSAVVSEIIRQFKLIRILQLWQTLIAVMFVLTELGVGAVGLILFQPLIFALVLITRNKLLIWFANIFALLLTLVYKKLTLNENFLTELHLNEDTAYLTMLSICWINLRCVSYCIDLIDAKEKHDNVVFLSYCLYLPNLVIGPFISYKDFKGCHQHSGPLWNRLIKLCIDVFRLLFWLAFVELCLHFVYVNAIFYHPHWIQSFDSWSLYGYGYTMGQYFHMKYLISYGLTTAFAKFENVQVPSLPVCIGRIHLYSDMWKYFDAGLYNFLLRYIYIPLIKNPLIKMRLFPSLVCFLFVYVWHGVQYIILIWTVLNYIGILIEHFSKMISDKYLRNSKLHQKLGDKWYRRMTCMAASPLLAMSAISNFYFFSSADIGNIFVSRIFNDKISSTVILLAILYTCCQVSTEVKSKLHNSAKKQISD